MGGLLRQRLSHCERDGLGHLRALRLRAMHKHRLLRRRHRGRQRDHDGILSHDGARL